jgi:filamentous hemagglutinin family protein
MMKLFKYSFLFLQSSFNCFFLISIVGAEIIPDTTLPNSSAVTTINNAIMINGGTQAGGNLFHSFEHFNIPTNTEAIFNNSADIQNIITRVTGSTSQIDGVIRTANKANLYLINANGFIFGENARLNIGGSFLATSAMSLKFADGVTYSANTSQNTPLLTISAPIGLNFSNNNGAITVRGRGHDLSGTPFKRTDYTTGLQVSPGQSIALVGGKINLDGAVLTAPAGQVELASIKDQGTITINPDFSRFNFSYPSNLNFDDIDLSNKSLIDVNGTQTGTVQLHGDQISFKDGSLVWLQNRGVQQSGDINVFASGSVELTGTTANNISSGLVNETIAAGASKNINITTPQLILRSGAIVAANTYDGASGNINIRAKSIGVFDYSPNNARVISNISALTYSQGDAGNINLSTGSISIFDGGFIGSGAISSGASGNVNIKAENILVSGIGASGDNSSITSSSWRDGSPGKINIDTAKLKVSDGGLISSSSFSNSPAGNVTINASDSVEITGKSVSTTSQIRSAVRVFGSEIKDRNLAANIREQLKLPDVPKGNAGDITINTRNLLVNDGARISVQNQGIGNGGTLNINAGLLSLDNKSSITANTMSGVGGNIKIKDRDLRLRHNSGITATAQGSTGSGGNIDINTKTLLALENSDIFANAEASFAGKININATGIFGTEFHTLLTPQSDIAATSQQGSSFNGVVSINSLSFNPNITVTDLPSNLTQATKQIVIACAASAGNKFVVVGRGGLPENPTNTLRGETIWSDVRPHQEGRSQISTLTNLNSNTRPIIEATGWVKDTSGNVELVARFPHQESQPPLKCKSS